MQEKVLYTYRLKKETEELLTDKQKGILLKLLEKIPSMPEEEVEEAIWQFTYWIENANIKYGFYGNELTDEQAKCVRKELIKHYKRIHPFWLFDQKFMKAPYDKVEAILKFRNKVQCDKVIVYQVVMRIERYVKKNYSIPNKIERTVHELKSKHEKSRFGGLRKLNFTYEEAVFLKPYAKVIAIVLKEMFEKWSEISKK